MKPVNLLALDTSTEACSAAVLINGKTIREFDVCPQQHSQQALPMVERMLQQGETNLAEMDYLVFGRGPGSFTGVRIGTGMIQGLALGAKKRAIGISTLAAMAQQSTGKRVAVAIDARMSEVYYAEFEKTDNAMHLVKEEVVIAPDIAAASAVQFAPDSIAGTGWAAYPELAHSVPHLTADILYPSAEAMLQLAQAEISNANGEPVGQPANKIEPVYLRDKVTWKKLPGRE